MMARIGNRALMRGNSVPSGKTRGVAEGGMSMSGVLFRRVCMVVDMRVGDGRAMALAGRKSQK